MATSFTINLADLTKILEQIRVAERHAAGESLVDIIGQSATLLPIGLRTVDGSFNHLLPGTTTTGAADTLFPRMLPYDFRVTPAGGSLELVRADVFGAPPGGVIIFNHNYDPTIAGSHSVSDAQLRLISNLIVDATLNNPAALNAALILAGSADPEADAAAIIELHNDFKAAAATLEVKQHTEVEYQNAVASAATVVSRIAAAQAALSALLAGVTLGGTVDAADSANAAAALAAAQAAVLAQQAVVKALVSDINIAPIHVTDAQALLTQLHTLVTTAQTIVTGLVDATVEQADLDAITAAQASAGTAATAAGTDQADLIAAEVTAQAERVAAGNALNTAGTALSAATSAAGLQISDDGSITVENRSPDIGLSPPFNGWMTFFGQFFDHGLDLVTKGGNGTVYIPLNPDDPLYDKGRDGLVGPQQARDADGNLLYYVTDPALTPSAAPATSTIATAWQVMHNDDGYGADGIFGTLDDRPNFMALTRATTFVDPATGLRTETQNTTTPFVDQNQTYTSHSSHQVFLREYKMVDIATDTIAGPVAVATGKLLDGGQPGSIANWAEVKLQAKEKLGLTLHDHDVNDVPLLVADPYGKFIPGAHGFAQVVVSVSIVNSAGVVVATVPNLNFAVEGVAGGLDLANIPNSNIPLAILGLLPPLNAGENYKLSTVGTGHAFLNDIAHHAAPGFVDHDHNPFTPKIAQVADADILDFNGDGVINNADLVAGAGVIQDVDGDNAITLADLADVNLDGVVDAKDLIADDRNPLTYDNEMLDAHFLTGDGRGNENIGLTAVHTIFHSEHNRLVEANKDTIFASGDVAVINEWLLPIVGGTRARLTQADVDAINALAPAAKAVAIDALQWDGERLFQAARFVTEMQYQHLVFEEFARKIQPNVDAFVFTNSADLDPSIVAEFAHVVYRFGHSMLTDTVDRLDNNLQSLNGDPQIGLIEAFLNPQAFTASGVTASDAAGAIIRGMTRQVGNEIDEFVVEALRNNLVGLPLDLAALNMARGRETGVPSFNDARAQFYAQTGDAQLKPYTSWLDFSQNIKNPLSVVNFIAAYGKHASVLAETTAEGKRAAAMELVLGVDENGAASTITDRLDFLNSTGTWTAESSGLNDVDFWIGGLAEEKMEFGGMLGSTFNFVFETQLENLQNGDRFYYLSRTQGMNLLNQLEPNTFADLVMRNTSLGDKHSTHVSAILFDTPDMILELDTLVAQEDYNGSAAGKDPRWSSVLQQAIDPKVVRIIGTTDVDGDGEIDGNVLKFSGGEHVVLGGTEGGDRLLGDKGIDTLWGDGGNDYLNAGMESDQVFGGEGDDIIEDPFGDDMLRGNAGNDVISSGHGFDLLFGDSGNDFIMIVTDASEVFAGEGDDFVLGGSGGDALMGNEGDDWIEGGEGFDSVTGENSDLFFNSPIIGHDVLNGQGNDTDYDGESGDDIMVQGAGIQRNNGMLGFDWVIHKGDVDAANTDLGISRFLNQQAFTLRDRNDSVEAVSGWKFNDTLTGTNVPTGAVGIGGGIIGGPVTDSMLLSQNVSLINGLETLLKLTPGALRGQTVGADATPFAALPKDTVVFDPSNGGDIILGGAGSDTMFGKAGNDIIDGDRWLNVRIEVHANKDGTGAVLRSVDSLNEIKADMLAGLINPGQLKIVRELVTTGASAADIDVVTYAGARADYTITRNANGSVTVTDNVTTPIVIFDPIAGVGVPDALLGNEGTDTLTNIERIRFTNRDADGREIGFTFVNLVNSAATGAPVVVDANGGTPTEGQALTVNTAAIADADGLGTFSFQWQAFVAGNWVNIPAGAGNGTGAATATYTPGANQVGQSLRVQVSFTDAGGTPETVSSVATAAVGDLVDGANAANAPSVITHLPAAAGLVTTIGSDILTLTGSDDVASGLAGADTINGLAGNDSLDGNGGADVLNGGTGNDTLNGGAGADIIDGSDGDDSITGGNGNDSLIGGLGNDTFTYSIGDSVDTVDGGLGADVLNILGTAANESLDVLFAGGVLTRFENDSQVTGVETVTAALGAGVDTLTYDAVNTTTLVGISVNLTAGTASGFTSISGIENVTGGDGNDIITGSGTAAASIANALNGGAGDDTLIATVDNITDALNGGAGIDTADYSAYTTALTFVFANGTVVGSGAGGGTSDTITNIENFIGGSAGDTITGNGAVNRLSGGGGADTINGGGGNDTIVGGAGNDSLTGGAGADTLVFASGFGNDVVTDFVATPGSGERLDISAYAFTAATFAANVQIAVGNFDGVAGNETRVTIGSDTILLLGVNGAGANVITQQDFIL